MLNKKSLKDFFQKNTHSLAVPAIMLVLGILFVIFPEGFIGVTVKVVGLVLVLIGVIIACTLMSRYSPLILSIAIVFVVFGLVCIAFPGFVASLIIRVIALMVLISAGMRVYDAYRVKGKSDNFIQYIIVDAATILLGLVLLLIPLDLAGTIVRIVGIIMIVIGLSNVITIIRVYRDGKYVDDGSDVVWEE